MWHTLSKISQGYWHQRADRRHGNPPKVSRSY